MARSSTPSFVLELKLNTSAADGRELGDRFFIAFKMKNRLITHARKQIRKFRQDRDVKALLELRKAQKQAVGAAKGKGPAPAKAALSGTNGLLLQKRLEYGLSEWAFQEWIAGQQRKYRKSIDSDVAQNLASDVWRAAESVLFGKGMSLHYRKLEGLDCLSRKKDASGIRFRGGRVEWLGLSMEAVVRRKDGYAREALTHRVKYCRIVRKPMGTKWHYYVQLVLEGTPPRKHEFLPGGDTGLDPGVSCEAAVSENGCILAEITPARDRQKEIRRLQRKQGRSRRASNPQNYNGDGTVRKGPKAWKKSKAYKRDAMRLKTLYRKNASDLKQNEEALANRILCTLGSDIIAEPMDYAALQKKAGKPGGHRGRKRFGASIGKHAPGRFLGILERKLGYMGKEIFYVDRWKYRASQYDHSRDCYRKAGLGERWKYIRGKPIQRDLYSAFLLMCARDEGVPDRQKCIKRYRRFHKMHDACIAEMKAAGISRPSVFGF